MWRHVFTATTCLNLVVCLVSGISGGAFGDSDGLRSRFLSDGPRGWDAWHRRCLTAEMQFRHQMVYREGGQWLWQTDEEFHYFLNGPNRRRTFRKRLADGAVFHEVGIRRGADYSFYAVYNTAGEIVPTDVDPVPQSPGDVIESGEVSLPFCFRGVPMTELLRDPAFQCERVVLRSDRELKNDAPSHEIGNATGPLARGGDRGSVVTGLTAVGVEMTGELVEVLYRYSPEGSRARFLRGDGTIVFSPERDWAVVGSELHSWNDDWSQRSNIEYTGRGADAWPKRAVFIGMPKDSTEPASVTMTTYAVCRESSMPPEFFSFESVGLGNLAASPRFGFWRMAWFIMLNLGVAGLFAWKYISRRRTTSG